jgi:hypothetical protein
MSCFSKFLCTLNRKQYLLLFSFLGLLFLSQLILTPAFATANTNLQSSSTLSHKVFAWLFGYTGKYFLPQTQLGITTAQTISAAQKLSVSVGASNLVLVSVVGEEPAQPPWGLTNVNWGNSSQVLMLSSYVSNLKQYAKGGVYARLDLQQFNGSIAGGRSIYTEVSRFINRVGVNGFWLDHGPNLYNIMGQYSFNHMMQALSESHPTATFLVNDAMGCPGRVQCQKGPAYPWITPLSNDTWQKQTYISTSLASGTFNKLNTNAMGNLSAIWNCSSCTTKGKGMILHFDAYAQLSIEPMGLFANQATSEETSAIQLLTNEGIAGNAQYSGFSYYLMYPILGAATYNGVISGGTVNYHGTLYDSLSVGTYPRGTATSFTTIMANS